MASRASKTKKRRPHPSNLPELRKNNELEELLVFGYACKIFRDDARAAEVNKAKTQIPWMGDTNLMIDRYDGRGHLFDLTPYDVEKNRNSSSQLSEEELRVEALCDEERYLELHSDLMEKAAYEEEELKRLNEALSEGNSYGAVAFNYGDNADEDSNLGEETGSKESDSEEDDEPFECPPFLKSLLPAATIFPNTTKSQAIIEKTAMFIANHGNQMEFIIKMKQQANPLFGFLVFGDELNPYYKSLVDLIKKKRYVPVPKVKIKKNKKERTISEGSYDDDDDSDDGGSYLHPSLQGKKTNSSTKEMDVEKANRLTGIYTLSSDQVKDTTFAKLLHKMNQQTGRDSPQAIPQNGSDNGGSYADDESIPSMMHAGVMYSSAGQPPPPGTEATVLPGHEHYTDYGCDIDASLPHIIPPVDMIPPAPDMQPIIDKMADYVIRNGIEFEESMNRKNDPRFQFLVPGQFHHSYYLFKKQVKERDVLKNRLLKQREEALQKEVEDREENERLDELRRKKEEEMRDEERLARQAEVEREAAIAAGKVSVSFSIKSKEAEPAPLEKKAAFTYETSDEEGEEAVMYQQTEITDTEETQPFTVEEPAQIDCTIADITQDTDVSIDILEKKFAEERLKDKLALAAREKLVQATKDKQLQVERKRKAALFINMLKAVPAKTEKHENVDKIVEDPKEEVQDIKKVVEDVVSSLIGASNNDSRSSSPLNKYPDRTELSATSHHDSRRCSMPDIYSGSSHIVNKVSSQVPDRHNSHTPDRRCDLKFRRSRTPPSSYSTTHSRSRSKSPRTWHRARSQERNRVQSSYELYKVSSYDAYDHTHRPRSRSRSKHHKSRSSPSKRRRSRSRSHSKKKKKRSKSPSKSKSGHSRSHKHSKRDKKSISKDRQDDAKCDDQNTETQSPLPTLSDLEDDNDLNVCLNVSCTSNADTKLKKEEIMNKMKAFREKLLNSVEPGGDV